MEKAGQNATSQSKPSNIAEAKTLQLLNGPASRGTTIFASRHDLNILSFLS